MGGGSSKQKKAKQYQVQVESPEGARTSKGSNKGEGDAPPRSLPNHAAAGGDGAGGLSSASQPQPRKPKASPAASPMALPMASPMASPAISPRGAKTAWGEDEPTERSNSLNRAKSTKSMQMKSPSGSREFDQKAIAGKPKSSQPLGEDAKWHSKNCKATMLVHARTIEEAYPFDANKKKKVHKKEIHFGMTDRRDGHGHCVVNDMGPRKLTCRMCSELMIDLANKELREGTFYFCRHCKEHNHRYHVCASCRAAALGQAEEPAGVNLNLLEPTSSWQTSSLSLAVPGVVVNSSPRASAQGRSDRRTMTTDPNGMTRQISGNSSQGRSDRRTMTTDPNGTPRQISGNPSQGMPSRSASRTATCPAGSGAGGRAGGGGGGGSGSKGMRAQSGMWKGTITEGKYTRDLQLTLTFSAQGAVTGSGPPGEDYTISGSWRELHADMFQVDWNEKHPWGSVAVTGKMTQMKDFFQVVAKSSATDGGEGSIMLKKSL